MCLQCAVLAAPAGGAGAALAAAGTLLEAFGNAATARNHNASRFVSSVIHPLHATNILCIDDNRTLFVLGQTARGGVRLQRRAGRRPYNAL